MNSGAGPVSLRMAPEPTNRPVPMAPPAASQSSSLSDRHLHTRKCGGWGWERDWAMLTKGQELDVSTLEAAFQLLMLAGQVELLRLPLGRLDVDIALVAAVGRVNLFVNSTHCEVAGVGIQVSRSLLLFAARLGPWSWRVERERV